jgi:hypothetical protein
VEKRPSGIKYIKRFKIAVLSLYAGQNRLVPWNCEGFKLQNHGAQSSALRGEWPVNSAEHE